MLCSCEAIGVLVVGGRRAITLGDCRMDQLVTRIFLSDRQISGIMHTYGNIIGKLYVSHPIYLTSTNLTHDSASSVYIPGLV